jgi:hypothetical protein
VLRLWPSTVQQAPCTRQQLVARIDLKTTSIMSKHNKATKLE